MRTVLAIIGALAIFVVVAFVILVVAGLNAIKPLTAEATAYADASISAIATEWDGEALKKRASSELKAELTDEKVDGVMSFGAENLGLMTNYQGASCMIVNFEVTTADGELVQASCDARAEHEGGGAGYSVALIKRNDAWALLSFFVIPDEITNTDDRTQMVAYEDPGLNAFTASFAERSIGLTSKRTLPVGADVYGFEKIENIP